MNNSSGAEKGEQRQPGLQAYGDVLGKHQAMLWVWRARYLGRGNRTQRSLDDHAEKWHLIVVMEVVGGHRTFCGEDVVTCLGQACV